MVIATLETIHRLLKIELAEAKLEQDVAAEKRKKALDKMDSMKLARVTNSSEYDPAYEKVIAEEVAEAEADNKSAYKRFQSAEDALIDFEGYQF